jgi:hypothetical protein
MSDFWPGSLMSTDFLLFPLNSWPRSQILTLQDAINGKKENNVRM